MDLLTHIHNSNNKNATDYKNNHNVCSICLDGNMKKNQPNTIDNIQKQKTTLPCNHTFHSRCILEYIINCIKQNEEKKCPDCRRVIDNNFFMNDKNYYLAFLNLDLKISKKFYEILRNNGHKYNKKIPIQVYNNKNIVLNIVKNNGLSLEFASDELKNDRDIVYEAVANNGISLEFASEELKQDYLVVEYAIMQNGLALQYVSEELKNDPEIILTAIEQNGLALQYVSEELKNDPEILLTAIKQNENAFHYVPDTLKNDKDFILDAVENNGHVLKCLSKEFRDDKDIVYTAFSEKSSSLQYASTKLRKDKQFILYHIKKGILEYASEELRNDRDFILKAISEYENAYDYASDELKVNKDIILAVFNRGRISVLENIPSYLKEDKDFMLKFITRYDESALNYVSKKLKEDKDFMLKAVKNNEYAFYFVPKELKEDKDIILELIKKHSRLVDRTGLPQKLKNDKYYMLEVVSYNYRMKYHASEELKKDKYINLVADRTRQDYTGHPDTSFNDEYKNIINNRIQVKGLSGPTYMVDSEGIVSNLNGDIIGKYDTNMTFNKLSDGTNYVFISCGTERISPFQGNKTIKECFKNNQNENNQNGGTNYQKYLQYKNDYVMLKKKVIV